MTRVDCLSGILATWGGVVASGAWSSQSGGVGRSASGV